MVHDMLAPQIVALGQIFRTAARRRSRALLRGSCGRGFGMVVAGARIGLAFPFGATWTFRDWPTAHMGAVRTVGVFAVLYLDVLRVVVSFDVGCRSEAFDLEHLAQLVERRNDAPAAAAAVG